MSSTVNMNTTSARRMFVWKLTLSPDSTGIKKPRKETRKMRKQGKMRLTT